MDRETALTGIEKSVEALVKIQWDLKSYNTLTVEVRETLIDVGAYYFGILVEADEERAMALFASLAKDTAERSSEDIVNGFEDLLGGTQ